MDFTTKSKKESWQLSLSAQLFFMVIKMPAVTILIDEKILEEIRKLQAKRIQKSLKNISFSRIVNEVLKKGLEK